MPNEKQLLVVEDDAELLETIIAALKRAGFACTGVASVQEAQFKLKIVKYACVILDLKLGDSSGEDIVTFMRTRKDILNHQTPVLLASGNINSEIVIGLAGKVQGGLVKPLDMDVLCEKVKNLIGA